MENQMCRKYVLLIILFLAASAFSQSRPNNTIRGFIFDAASRNPVSDVYVELLDDVYATLKRVKTDASGQYGFSGLSSGLFKVKVLPYGTNYQEEIQDARIESFNFGNVNMSDSVYLDIYLKLDKRKARINEATETGSIFVQNVPETARSLYKKSISQLEKPKEKAEGIENLKKALSLFPDYYDALNKLGFEHIKDGQYLESIPYLVKAITINQRSFSSFYLLGLSAYNLKQFKESAEAFRAATIINPQSIDAYIHYGMVTRIDGKYAESEKALLKAESLAKDSPVSDINWQLALLYDKIKKYNEAADELEKYLKIQKGAANSKQIKDLIAQMRAKAKQ